MKDVKEREKKVRNKTIKQISIFDIACFIVVLAMTEPWTWNSDITRNQHLVTIVSFVILVLIFDLILWLLLKMVNENEQLFKESADMFDEKIPPHSEEVEVIPIRDDIPALKALKEYSKFYASNLGTGEAIIMVEVKDKEKVLFETIDKKFFTSYYKIKESE